MKLLSQSDIVFYWSVELFSQSGIVFIGVWNCSHTLVLFYWSVELFSQSGIVLLECGTVLTVWYCFYWSLDLFSQSGIVFIGVYNCSHSLILLLMECETVLTV